jgi:ATP-dependent HslUV protease ATP-binding subunit HslU
LKEELKREFDDFVDLVIMELLIGHQPDKKIRSQKLEEIQKGYYNHRYLTVPKSIIQNYNLFNSFEEYFEYIRNIYGKISCGWEMDSKRVTVKSFRNLLYDNLIENISTRLKENSISIKKIENDGIVFIDEIDKIAVTKKNTSSARSPSTDGVQRDMLPMVEGTMIKTSSGFINTKHILFITAGAFSHSKPQDLLPELLGKIN